MSLLKETNFLEVEKDAPLLILHHDDVLKKVIYLFNSLYLLYVRNLTTSHHVLKNGETLF